MNPTNDAPKPRVVFEFDPTTGACGWRMENHGFPLPLLVNVLELAKQFYLGQQLQGLVQKGAPGIVLPDGSPPPRY